MADRGKRRQEKQWLTGGKRGQEGIRKFEYLKNKKNFLGKIKSIFHNFLRAFM